MSADIKKSNVIAMPKTREYGAFTDYETGEILGYYTPRRKNDIGGGYMIVFQDFLVSLSQSGLTGEQHNVLCYLMGQLDFDNYLRVTQKSVCEALDMRKEHVSRSIKRLRDLSILVEGPKVGTAKTYRLNPHYATKGTRNYKSNIVEWDSLMKQKTESEKS